VKEKTKEELDTKNEDDREETKKEEIIKWLRIKSRKGEQKKKINH
jgi:hypothetical protein